MRHIKVYSSAIYWAWVTVEKKKCNSKFIDFFFWLRRFPIAACTTIGDKVFRANIWNIQIFMGLMTSSKCRRNEMIACPLESCIPIRSLYILFVKSGLCDGLINSLLFRNCWEKIHNQRKKKPDNIFHSIFNAKMYEYIFKIAFGLSLLLRLFSLSVCVCKESAKLIL